MLTVVSRSTPTCDSVVLGFIWSTAVHVNAVTLCAHLLLYSAQGDGDRTSLDFGFLRSDVLFGILDSLADILQARERRERIPGGNDEQAATDRQTFGVANK